MSTANDEGDLVYRNQIMTVARRLGEDFAGMFSAETIERYLTDSEDRVGQHRLTQFRMVFLERFARERLRALAQVEGKLAKDVPEVLFVCTHNAGRSQMAAALVDMRSGGAVHVRSAGSEPTDQLNPAVVEAMREIGADLSKEYPKPLTDEVVQAADVVITMGCGDACPIYPGKRYLDWDLTDPAGKSVEEVRAIRDEIDQRVQELVRGLTTLVES